MSASPELSEHPSIFFHQLYDHHQLDFKTIIIRLSSVSKSTRGLSNNHMRKRNVSNLLSASVMIMMAMNATRWTNVLRWSTAWTSWQHKILTKMYPWEKCRMPTGEHGLHRSWSPWGSFCFSIWKWYNFGDRPVSRFAVCESKIFFTAPPYFCQRWSLVYDLGQTAQDIVQRRFALPVSKWLPLPQKTSPAPASSPSPPPWSCSCSRRQTAKPGLGGVGLPGQEEPSSVQPCRFSDQWSSIYV